MDDLTADPPALILVQPRSSAHIPYFENPAEKICPDGCGPEVLAGLMGVKQYVAGHYKLTTHIYDWDIYRRLK